jgi:tetratricopeptide (TPR) repeat protein
MSRRAGAFVLILAAGVARADSPLVRGTEAFHARHYRDAAAAFRAAPTDPEATYRLGVALVAAGDVPGAVDAWERVLLLDPAHARARRNLELFRTVDDDATRIARARALVARGRAASAVALLEGVASPEAALVRLEARALAGEPAGDDAALALAVAPASARPLRALADGAALAGDDARARRLYELYIGRFGGEPDARAVRRWLEHPRRSPPDHDRSSGDAEPPPAPDAPP